jgi:uncharacterized membrane protein
MSDPSAADIAQTPQALRRNPVEITWISLFAIKEEVAWQRQIQVDHALDRRMMLATMTK